MDSQDIISDIQEVRPTEEDFSITNWSAGVNLGIFSFDLQGKW